MATDCATEWEYCHLGPADSFLGLLGDLKVKTSQGWELAGVTNDSARVYATVKRPVRGLARELALAEQKVA